MRIFRACLFSLLPLFLLSCVLAHGETDVGKMLRTKGKNIVNGKGETVQLQGINAGGWLVQEGWMCLTNAPSQTEAFSVLDDRFGKETREHLFEVYEDNYWSESDFDNIKAMGMNVVRLPITWWHILDDEGNLRPDAFERIDWFVDCCAARDLYVILDLHAAPGSQNGNDHSGDITGSHLWEEAVYQDRTQFLWEQIAAHYRGNATVAAYDLLNEPGGELNSTGVMQWEFFDRLYEAIRVIDPEHIIIMESCWGPEDLPDPDEYGWENVVYQYHYYKWGADNDYNAQKLAVDVNLHKLKETDHPVPSFIGEFTLFQNEDAWKYALNAYNDAGLSWTIWTYKVTGNSSWGLYNVHGEKVDIYEDTAEEIEEKWSQQGALVRNEWLHGIVSGILAGEEAVLPDAPAEHTDRPVEKLEFSQVTALNGAEIAEEEDAYRLTTLESVDPGNSSNGIAFQLTESIDASTYQYLTFFIKDLQGNNTHMITMADSSGNAYNTWVDILSVQGEWTRINVPLSMFGSIDLSSLQEIRVGEWNSGDYLLKDFWLCDGTLDE